MSQRTVLLTVAVVAAGLIALGLRLGLGGAGTIDTNAPGSVADDTVPQEAAAPPTSESLIAEALAAGDQL